MSKIVERRGVSRMAIERVNFTWVIENFSVRSALPCEPLYSPIFSQGRHAKLKWNILAYPGGLKEEDPKRSLALFLGLADNSTVRKAHARYQVAILDAAGEKFELDEIDGPVSRSKATLGFRKYISRDNILDGLLVDDKLTLHFSITGSHIPEKDRVPKEAAEGSEDDAAAPNEVPQLLTDLGQLVESPMFSDVTLVAGETEIPAHKSILASRSVVFKAMFENQMREAEEGRVVIIDVEPAVLREILRFIYTGRPDNLDQMASSLLSAADKYALQGLSALCEQHLCDTLCVHNAVAALILAHQHSAERLKTKTLEVIGANAAQLMESDVWQMLQLYPPLLAEAFSAVALAPSANELSPCGHH